MTNGEYTGAIYAVLSLGTFSYDTNNEAEVAYFSKVMCTRDEFLLAFDEQAGGKNLF